LLLFDFLLLIKVSVFLTHFLTHDSLTTAFVGQ
jgi:hypothetical protein